MGWFKVWDREWLENTANMPMGSQGAFIRALCLANTILDGGRFSYEKKIPLSPEQIITGAEIPSCEWEYLKKYGMITQVKGFWAIKNWVKYQSEYQRQKGYRQKLQPKITSKGTA